MGKKQSDIPEDVNKELESPKFGKPTEITASGYVLDINDKDNKRLMKEILQNCVSANFGGGEPLMNPFIDDLLKEIQPDVELTLNTNGTTLSDRTLALLENRSNLIDNTWREKLSNGVLGKFC